MLTDGPYGGGVCGATNHSHHRNAQDSVYQQYRLQAQFYRKLFSQGCAPALSPPSTESDSIRAQEALYVRFSLS